MDKDTDSDNCQWRPYYKSDESRENSAIRADSKNERYSRNTSKVELVEPFKSNSNLNAVYYDTDSRYFVPKHH